MSAALLAFALFAAWEAYARLGGIDALLLPAPTQILESLADDRAILWNDFLVTATEVVLGIALALAFGVLVAVALHLSDRTLRPAVYPLLIGSQTIPIPLLAPVLVAWLGFGLAPKLAIVALVCFFPVAVTTLDGLRRVDPAIHKLFASLGATRWQLLRHVELPAALPAILSGARISVAIALIGAVLAELSGASDGLGLLIQQSNAQLETARAWAAVAVLSAFAVLLVWLLTLAERRLAPWTRHQH